MIGPQAPGILVSGWSWGAAPLSALAGESASGSSWVLPMALVLLPLVGALGFLLGRIHKGWKGSETATPPELDVVFSGSGREFRRRLQEELPAALGLNEIWLLETDSGASSGSPRIRLPGGGPGEADPLVAEVMSRGHLLLPAGARERFPDSRLLQQAGAECLVGDRLLGLEDELLGVLLVAGRRPLQRPGHAAALVRLWASRAALELRQAKEAAALGERIRILQTVLDTLSSPIFFKDHKGLYLGCNSAFESFIGLPRERIIGQTVFGVAPADLAETYYRADQDLFRAGGSQVYEALVEGAEGRKREVMFQKTVFLDEKGQKAGLVGIMTDISDRKNAERTIEYLGNFDPLTQLPNQILFIDRLNHEVSHCHRLERSFGVCCLDLDEFKRVNNVFGHEAGNRLLKEVASRLQACLEEDDTLARMGGDSFNMIMTQADAEESAKRIVRRILESFAAPFELDGREVHLTASLGLSLYPYDGSDGQTLLKNADNALYRAKERGSGSYQFFALAMNRRVEEQMMLENHLRQAFEAGEFTLVFQPQFAAGDLRLVGAEALLRLRHPRLGMVAPERFIPLAEQIGLIHELGDWVLRKAVGELRAWQKAGLPPLRMSVNLSARQFQGASLARNLAQILQDSGIAPDCLSLEITESVVMQDVDLAVETLHRFKSLGVHLAIDDFGTGYSSLSYLRRFPIDQLKIDRSFIMDIPERADDQAIVEAILALGRALNLRVLAEGVEREEQRRFLAERGCHELQGYLLGEPVAGEEFARRFFSSHT